MNDDLFHPFKSRREAQMFCKGNFTSKMLRVLKYDNCVDCRCCPLDHRAFDKFGLDNMGRGYPCHVIYLALIGQLTKERYAAIMHDTCVGNDDILWCTCEERRMRAYKFITGRDESEIISVE